MDESTIADLVQKCRHLKHHFAGVFSASNFTPLTRNKSFQIVNTDPTPLPGTHWVVMARKDKKVIFADPLGFPLAHYPHLFYRCLHLYDEIVNYSYQLQPKNSKNCGLYCLYLAHLILSPIYPAKIYIDEVGLIQFVQHFL